MKCVEMFQNLSVGIRLQINSTKSPLTYKNIYAQRK